MNAWKVALIVAFVGMSLGWMFYTAPEDKPVPESIAIHSAAPERVVIEAP